MSLQNGGAEQVVVTGKALNSDDDEIAYYLNNGQAKYGMKGSEGVQRLQQLLGMPENMQTGNYLGKTKQAVADWRVGHSSLLDKQPASYFDTPISHLEGEAGGLSRKGGAVSPQVKQLAINTLISMGALAGRSNREIAVTLAIADQESGFNPDAASRSSTATGIGQFTVATGAAYGINDENRFNIDAQAGALTKLTGNSISMLQKAKLDDSTADLAKYVYKIHHDGSLITKDTPEYLSAYPKVVSKVPYYLDYVNRVNK